MRLAEWLGEEERPSLSNYNTFVPNLRLRRLRVRCPTFAVAFAFAGLLAVFHEASFPASLL